MVFRYLKNPDNEYLCQHCGFTTPKQNTMHYHLQKHEGVYKYECSTCDKKFYQKKSYDMHMQVHHDVKGSFFECADPKCSFTNRTEGNCRIHYARMHCKEGIAKILQEQDKKPSCTACSQSFKSMTSFYYHAFECLGLQNTTYCKKLSTPLQA